MQRSLKKLYTRVGGVGATPRGRPKNAIKTKTTGSASDQFAEPVVFKMKKGGKNEKVILFMILS